MKRSLLFMAAGMLLVASCKENDAKIVFPRKTSTGSLAVDSTYTLDAASTAALTTDPHVVLVEEFSGQSCINCPQGHTDLEDYQAAHPGTMNYISLYATDDGPQGNPITGCKYDLRNDIAKNIAAAVAHLSVSSMPGAIIDRVPDATAGMYNDSRVSWDGDITADATVIDSMNLKITSSYNGDSASIIATVTYTQAVATSQNLSLVLVEDSLIDWQSDGRNVDTYYVFTGVLRDMISTPPLGDPILDTIAVKEKGRVYLHRYSYKLPALPPFGGRAQTIDPAHCRVVAYINSPGTGGNYRIQQSATTKLMGP